MAGIERLKRKVKPNGHLIKDQKVEITFGILLFIAGMLLLWDAFDGRGKNMPWPASGLMPW